MHYYHGIKEKQNFKANTQEPKLVLVWEPYPWYKDSEFDNCSYPCKFTLDKSKIEKAHAIVFWGWSFPKATFPTYRHPDQVWIFMLNESPKKTAIRRKGINITMFNGMFNWTFSYKRDSDIRHRDWKFVKKLNPSTESIDYAKNKKKLVLAAISNCKNLERLRLVKKIKSYLGDSMDFIGLCSKTKCKRNCPNAFRDYKFFLAFENSYYCKDYITEKFYTNALMNEAIPIAKGPHKSDYLENVKNFPNHSFIHVDDFKDVKELVSYIRYLNKNPDKYNEYHQWRKYFDIRLERDYWCDICQKLHTDNRKKTYGDLVKWFNTCENFHIE